jgi:cytochrome c-type biogenesis protein CcmH/NrfG
MPKPSPASASFSSNEQKYAEAASAYRKALALNPKLPTIQLNLGLAEFKQGRFKSAAALHAALSADPASVQAGTLLGLSYYGAQQYTGAVKVS